MIPHRLGQRDACAGARFALPARRLRDRSANFAPIPSARKLQPRSGMAQVLLVDDDADIRDSLGGILREEGHSVQLAKNGLEALQALSSSAQPDVVLLDLLMPVMDGWTFLSRLRECSELASVQVVVMSAGTRGAEGAAERRVPYLSKPLCITSLLHLIANVRTQGLPAWSLLAFACPVATACEHAGGGS
jgi:CheY-like chemotaxis protein